MGYEDAKATKLLATHCAACGRPLVDAISVETGLGPECRKRHGYNAAMKAVDEETRALANQLVYLVATSQTGIQVAEATARLRELGFGKLADRIEKRAVSITIEELPSGRFAVKSPFDEDAVAAMKVVPGRRWNRDEKVNTFPVTSKGAIWDILKRYYPGAVAVGPKGPFQVPA
jgi:hypothetical protein